MAEREIGHTRGKPYHPMTQGKIERYHRSLKNVVKLQNYCLPWELEREFDHFVDHYNHRRGHESLKYFTPADVYQGRGREILSGRNVVNIQTLDRRKRKPGDTTPKIDTVKPAWLRESFSCTSLRFVSLALTAYRCGLHFQNRGIEIR